jgi:hypothetical protein
MLLTQLEGVVASMGIVLPVKCIGCGIKSLQELGEWWQTNTYSWSDTKECTYEWLVVMKAVNVVKCRVTF